MFAEDRYGDCCSIVAEIGDGLRPFERWGLWHNEHLPLPEDGGHPFTKPHCPVAVAGSSERFMVAIFGSTRTVEEGRERGPELTYESIEDLLRIVDVLASKEPDEGGMRADALLDPLWTASMWPNRRLPARIQAFLVGGGGAAGVGLGAAGVAAVMSGLPLAAILTGLITMPGLIAALHGSSKLIERSVEPFVRDELSGILRRNSLLDAVDRPFVAAKLTLPVLASKVSHPVGMAVVAINTVVEARGSKHGLRVRIGHWRLHGDRVAVEAVQVLPKTWVAFELVGPDELVRQCDCLAPFKEEGAARWVSAGDEPGAQSLVRALKSLQEAVERPQLGPYR